jgi:hypothetical protein
MDEAITAIRLLDTLFGHFLTEQAEARKRFLRDMQRQRLLIEDRSDAGTKLAEDHFHWMFQRFSDSVARRAGEVVEQCNEVARRVQKLKCDEEARLTALKAAIRLRRLVSIFSVPICAADESPYGDTSEGHFWFKAAMDVDLSRATGLLDRLVDFASCLPLEGKGGGVSEGVSGNTFQKSKVFFADHVDREDVKAFALALAENDGRPRAQIAREIHGQYPTKSKTAKGIESTFDRYVKKDAIRFDPPLGNGVSSETPKEKQLGA